MDEESEGTMGVLAAILLLFTAMLNPLTSLVLAAAGLLGAIVYAARRGQQQTS